MSVVFVLLQQSLEITSCSSVSSSQTGFLGASVVFALLQRSLGITSCSSVSFFKVWNLVFSRIYPPQRLFCSWVELLSGTWRSSSVETLK
ncbi:hypothetical protein ARALYDRAFT_891694 [Arabidopsis lyrata subsp. lyrata]|uniref:Uncharacterized protein n=1 Tax=Arabidopsis lyrata subsp. lyrata TaxID=81972 RepID=D7KD40_ARALL|nr:hypothetical protein ARALYDRAFT_891694 [Arabidopsis lyrata subsp. lyrata]